MNKTTAAARRRHALDGYREGAHRYAALWPGETIATVERKWGMIPRGTVIAALLVVELAIAGEAIVAVRGEPSAPASFPLADARTASGSRLVEGGPHQTFDAGAHPALTVDIGYADLTIVTRPTSQIDVGAGASTAYGFFGSKAPITVRKDGDTIHITTVDGRRWSIGDDRMVTVFVPPETLVTVVNAGDIRASGLRAEATFKSIGKGSVTVENYAAPALHVASSDGRISLHGIVAAHLDATSSDGRVEGTALKVRDGSVESDGRITLGFATGTDTLVTADTDNGIVRLSGFVAPASSTSGRKNEDGDNRPSSQTVRLGAGNGHLDVHSSDGNINLAQEG